MWLVKVGTNLIQIEVEGLEAIGFKIGDGEETFNCTNISLHEMVFVMS